MERFIRKEIARGRSGRVIVHDLVRRGDCDEATAMEAVARLGPAVYARLKRRYLIAYVVGVLMFCFVILPVVFPDPNIHSGGFPLVMGLYIVGLIVGPIMAAIGWVGFHRYKKWNPRLNDGDPHTARIEGFARESLKLGRGEWWIVSEIVRRSPDVTETQAREIVARVAPALFRDFIRRRRSIFKFGALGLALSIGVFFLLPHEPHVPMFSLLGAIISGFVMAYGWPALRLRASGDAPTSLPGNAEPSPVRTGLDWHADPFERQ